MRSEGHDCSRYSFPFLDPILAVFSASTSSECLTDLHFYF